MSDILQRLYDSEINFSLACFYDMGFSVSLGDPANGVLASATVKTMADAEKWLASEAVGHFPDSNFALAEGERTCGPAKP